MKKIIKVEVTKEATIWIYEDGTKEVIPFITAKEDDTSWNW